MEISKYDKDSLVGISVFLVVASLVYFFLNVSWWFTLLIASIIGVSAGIIYDKLG